MDEGDPVQTTALPKAGLKDPPLHQQAHHAPSGTMGA
jgi:hypothetical protein